MEPTDAKTGSASVAAYSDMTAEYGSDDDKYTVHNSSRHTLVGEVEDDREQEDDDKEHKELEEGDGEEGFTEILTSGYEDTDYGQADGGRAEQERNSSPCKGKLMQTGEKVN